MKAIQSFEIVTLTVLLVNLLREAPAEAQTAGADARDASPTTAPPDGIVRPSDVLDEISGNFVLGPGWFQAGDVEDRLHAHGFENVDTLAILFGLSGRLIFDNGFMVGAAGALAGHDAVDGPDAYDARLSYGVARAEGGYALLSSERWLLLPTLGIGGYSAHLQLNDDRDASFDELLESTGTTTSLSSSGLLLSAIVDFAVRFPLTARTRSPRGFLSIGVEGGYLYSVPFGRWQSSAGGDVDDGPDAELTGGFVGLTLGGGAYGI